MVARTPTSRQASGGGPPPQIPRRTGQPRNAGSLALGGCTLATVADMMQTWTGSAPLPAPPFVNAYLALTGANSAAGLSTSQVLNYWRSSGIDGYRITNWSGVRNFTSRNTVEVVMRNGALFATVNMPTADLELGNQDTAIWSTERGTRWRTDLGQSRTGDGWLQLNRPDLYHVGVLCHQATWSWWSTWATGLSTVTHAAPFTPNLG